MDGKREGYKVTVPATVDVKSIRKGLKLTQAAFSDHFGFSLDAVKHWEGGRRTPEVPARAYLTVIARNPAAVFEALRPAPAKAQEVEVPLTTESLTLPSPRKLQHAVAHFRPDEVKEEQERKEAFDETGKRMRRSAEQIEETGGEQEAPRP